MMRLCRHATILALSFIMLIGSTLSIGWALSPRQYADLTAPFYVEPITNFKKADRILRSDQPRQRLIRTGNTIYVTNTQNITPEKGQKFFIFTRQADEIMENQVLAHRVGTAKFEKKHRDVMTMDVVNVNGPMKLNDWVIPAKELTQSLPTSPAYTNHQVVGTVIDLIGKNKYTAQYHSIVIDIGQRDGLKPGTVFDIYRELDDVDGYQLPSEEVGTGFAYHVGSDASVALVTQSRLPISKGLEVVTREDKTTPQEPTTPEPSKPITGQKPDIDEKTPEPSNSKGPITTETMPRCDSHSPETAYSMACFTPEADYDLIHLYIQFAYDSAELSPSAKRTIDQFVDALKTTKAFVPFTLNGYASMGVPGQPFESYNLELSEKRADVVRDYMIQKGINSDMINMQAHGWHNPLVPNASTELRHINQRVSTSTKAR